MALGSDFLSNWPPATEQGRPFAGRRYKHRGVCRHLMTAFKKCKGERREQTRFRFGPRLVMFLFLMPPRSITKTNPDATQMDLHVTKISLMAPTLNKIHV